MPRYQTKDGQIYDAANLTKLMDMMHADAFEPVPLRQWMYETAARARATSGFPVYGDGTRKKLAEDLITAGLIKVLEPVE